MPSTERPLSRSDIEKRSAQQAAAAGPHVRAFWEELLPNMSLYPLSSQNLRTHALLRGSAPVRLDEAITCPWIALNSKRRTLALCVDVDHADGPELIARLPTGCPKPTLVIDPWSGRSHAILPLATPVLTGPGSRKLPIGLAKFAHALLAAALRGTALPFTSLVKCPTGLVGNLTGLRMLRGRVPATPLVWDAYVECHSGLMWVTQLGDGAAQLNDVVNALLPEHERELPESAACRRWRKKRGEPSARGRNCMVFDLVRWWAYDDCEQDLDKVTAEATRVNGTLSNPLPDAEVNSIARSIAKFMRDKYVPRFGGGRRGRDREVNQSLDTKGRQELAGRCSAAQRKAATNQRIVSAAVEMRAANEKITQTAVARRLNLCERTVRGHWTSVIKVLETKLARPGPEASAFTDVVPEGPGIGLPLAA